MSSAATQACEDNRLYMCLSCICKSLIEFLLVQNEISCFE